MLKYSDSSTQETRIREQFQYARNDFTLGYDVDVEMIDLPAGQYMVTFTFTDVFGNKNLQTDSIVFNLVD